MKGIRPQGVRPLRAERANATLDALREDTQLKNLRMRRYAVEQDQKSERR